MAKARTNRSRPAGKATDEPATTIPDASRPLRKAQSSDEDVLADIVVLRDIVKRLGPDRVIDLVKHFR